MQRSIFPLLLLCLPMLVGGCNCATVDSGEYGILVHTRGSNRGELEPLGIGKHTIGWFDDAFTYPASVQRVVWTEGSNEGSPVDEAFRLRTADQANFIADIGFSYHVGSQADALKIFRKYRRPVDVVTDGFIRDQVRKTAVSTAAQLRSDSLLGAGLEGYQAHVTRLLQDRLGPEGFLVDEFSVVRIEPADEAVKQAIASRSAARQQAIQREEELRAAIAQAKTDSVRSAAQARNAQLLQLSTTPQTIERMRLENERLMLQKWNGQLPQTIMPGINPFSVIPRSQ